MLTETTHNACKGLAYKILNGRTIQADLHPINSEDVGINAGFAQRFCLNLVEAHFAQVQAFRNGEPPKNMDSVIAELLHGNDANPFYSVYKAALATATMNWTSAFLAHKSMINGGLPAEKAEPLLYRAYDVIPVCTTLLYSMLKLGQPELHYDLANAKAAEVHISLQGILNS